MFCAKRDSTHFCKHFLYWFWCTSSEASHHSSFGRTSEQKIIRKLSSAIVLAELSFNYFPTFLLNPYFLERSLLLLSFKVCQRIFFILLIRSHPIAISLKMNPRFHTPWRISTANLLCSLSSFSKARNWHWSSRRYNWKRSPSQSEFALFRST